MARSSSTLPPGGLARWRARRKSFLHAWNSRVSRRTRRLAEEFPSAWRALLPAWPVALVSALTAVLLTVPRQGREVLDVTIDLGDAIAVGDWERLRWFAFAAALLFLHSLMMMGAAFFLLSIDRRQSRHLELSDAEGADERERSEPRTPQDPLSPSIALRTRTALAFGLLTPATLVAALAGSYAFDGLITFASLWWLALWLAAAALVLLSAGVRAEQCLIWSAPLGVILAGLSAAGLAYARSRDVLATIEPWAPWMAAAATASVWHFVARGLDWRTHRRLEEIRAIHAARQARGERTPRIIAMAPWLLYALRTVSHFPTRNIIAALATLLVVVGFPRTVENFQLYYAGAGAAAVVIVLIAFVYALTRARLMREHEGQGERRLVVDRRAERYYRGAALLCLLLVPIALWPPPVYRAIGPVGVLLVGSMGVSVVLVWFVRAAISPAKPLFSAPQTVPFQVRPLFMVGAIAESLQGLLTPARILAIGVALLLADWFIIGSVARLFTLAPVVGAVAAGLAVLAVISLSAATLLLFRKRRRTPPASAIAGAIATSVVMVAVPAVAAALNAEPGWPAVKTAAALALVLAAPVIAFQIAAIGDRLQTLARRDPIRVPTLLMIAPFVIMGLGENHYIAMTPFAPEADVAQSSPGARTEQETVLSARDHAEAWLQRRIALAGEDEPITAVVVLAEGGGIRAAAHAGLAVAHLDEQFPAYCAAEPRPALCPAGDAPARLLDQIYTFSGVSGGSVGVAAYLAAKADEAERGVPAPDAMVEQVRRTVGADHVSALFAGLFAVDLPIVLLPTQLPHDLFRDLGLYREDYRYTWINRRRGVFDRADFFERSLGREWRTSEGLTEGTEPTDWFEQPFESVVDKAAAGSPGGVAPIVMFGTFESRDAYLSAASNVAFDACPYAAHYEPPVPGAPSANTASAASSTAAAPLVYSGFASIQDCFPQNRVDDGRFVRAMTMPLSTAAHISARFPGSNPSAVVETYVPPEPGADDQTGQWAERRFVDGGYYDNSGAAGALHALRALHEAAEDLGVETRLRVAVLHIFTRDVAAPDSERGPRRDSVGAELLTPLNAVWSARARSGRQPVRTLCLYLASTYTTTPEQSTAADRVCEGLEQYRQTDAAGLMSWRGACPPAVMRDVLEQQSAAPRYPVPWVNMPLDIADQPDNDAAPYALLGWSLKAETQSYIDEVTGQAAGPALAALSEVVRPGSVRAPAGGAAWGCE